MLLWLEPDLKSFSTRDVQQKKAELSAPHQAGFQQIGLELHASHSPKRRQTRLACRTPSKQQRRVAVL